MCMDEVHSLLSRRDLLRAAGVVAGVGAVAAALPQASAAASPQPTSNADGYRTRAVLLGTLGGPIWFPGTDRAGIATALAVGNATYLIDLGDNWGRRMQQAGLFGPQDGQNDLQALRAVFLTHLHSDHTIGYPSLIAYGIVGGGLGTPSAPVQVYGPPSRGALPKVFPPSRPTPPVTAPGNPEPGTVDLTNALIAAYATDLNDRTIDAASPTIASRLQAHDIALPAGAGANPNAKPPRISPFPVYSDDLVQVSATLVDHGQIFPAFAFRFDTADGSIVFSGDTTVSPNLIELAQGCDVLVHEVIDQQWVQASIAGLPVPQTVKDAYLNHMLGAHTTIEQVGQVAEQAGAKTLVLTHLVPGNNPDGRWQKPAANYSGQLVVGRDLLAVGVGKRS